MDMSLRLKVYPYNKNVKEEFTEEEYVEEIQEDGVEGFF